MRRVSAAAVWIRAEPLATARRFFMRPPSLADTSSQRCGPTPG
jgi:hypothetical protein